MEPNPLETQIHEPNLSTSTELNDPNDVAVRLEECFLNLINTDNPSGEVQEDIEIREVITESIKAMKLDDSFVPIWQTWETLRAKPELRWKSYERLQALYPGLLRDREEIENEEKKQVSLFRSGQKMEQRNLYEYPGIIKEEPKLLEDLSETEYFFLILALDEFEKNIPTPRYEETDGIEIVRSKTIDIDTEKEEFEYAKYYLLGKTKDYLGMEDPEGIYFLRGACRWFCVNEKILFKEGHWKGIEKFSVVSEFLVRIEKALRERDNKQGLTKLLNMRDWRTYEIEKGDYLERFM